MAEINEETEDKLNYIGIGLSELKRISEILQACLEYYDEFQPEDLRIMLNILQSKITEIKKDFSNIQAELNI